MPKVCYMEVKTLTAGTLFVVYNFQINVLLKLDANFVIRKFVWSVVPLSTYSAKYSDFNRA